MMGLHKPVKNIYCIGDNVCTDIFGANLYNNYLQRRQLDKEIISHQASVTSVTSVTSVQQNQTSRCIDKLIGTNELSGAESFFSVLVQTGELGFIFNLSYKYKLSWIIFRSV